MAIIKYHDGNQNLIALGASGDHTHSPESIGAAKKEHDHDLVSAENDGFMSIADKAKVEAVNDAVFGNSEQDGLVDLVGDTPVSEQISDMSNSLQSEIATASTNITTAANKYTDDKIADLINGAPTTLDTLGEIATAMEENADVVEALDQAIGTKAPIQHDHVASEITDLQGILDTKVPTTRTVNGKALDQNISLSASDVGAAIADHEHNEIYYTEAEIDNRFDELVGEHAVSEQITESINNLIKELSVNGTTITYTRVDGTTGTINTQDTNTTYSVMTGATSSANGTSGLVPAPSISNRTQFLRGDGTWVTPTNTTYSASNGISLSGTTFSNSGVRSVDTGSTDGTISVNTNGTTSNVAVKGLGSAAYTASTAYDASGAASTALSEAKTYVDNKFTDFVGDTAVSEQITTAVASKQNTITGAATTITGSNLTTDRALISNASGKVAASVVTSTELGYLDGVTSNVQTQLNGKSATGHSHTASEVGAAAHQVMSNTDFNTMKQPGIYTMESCSTNVPTPSSATYYSLIVTNSDDSSSGYIHQIAISEGTHDTYLRYCNSGTWSAWKKLALSDEVGGSSVGVFSTSADGLVPKPSSSTTNQFLNASGSWSVPYSIQAPDTSSKRFLIGTDDQSGNAYTSSNSSCYMENGHLYSNGSQVLTGTHMHNPTDSGMVFGCTEVSFTATSSGQTNSFNSTTIQFGKTFSMEPLVFITMIQSSVGYVCDMTGICNIQVVPGTSSFDLYWTNTSGSARSAYVGWIAVPTYDVT